MSPEIRAVYQEIKTGFKKVQDVLFRGVNRFKLQLACAGASVVAACAPQPTPEQTQRFQEPPMPKDAVVLVVTNTPTPELPTSTPAPATATPESPPTATPTPIRREQPPAPVQESLFQTWGIYSGPLMPARGLESRGQIVIAPLPTDEILIFWMRKKNCDNNLQRESINSFLVRRESRAGRGFSQTDRLGHVFSFAVIRPDLLGGNVKFRDDVPVVGVPNCQGEELSSKLDLKGNGRIALGLELAAAKKSFSGGDNDPEVMIKLAQELCSCTIPDPK